ncbi:MAG TPA: hypothetical protein VLJ39_03355 [Tepidisphaeraceae bacterium]|nr:hypothetical protein [Tepidisphaeraceae bacterium]
MAQAAELWSPFLGPPVAIADRPPTPPASPAPSGVRVALAQALLGGHGHPRSLRLVADSEWR